MWTEGLQTLFVFQRLGKGSWSQAPWRGPASFREPVGAKLGALPHPHSLPQRLCSTVTSTRGRRCTWVTPSSTRTRSGYARSLHSSAADGFPWALGDPLSFPSTSRQPLLSLCNLQAPMGTVSAQPPSSSSSWGPALLPALAQLMRMLGVGGRLLVRSGATAPVGT